MVRAAVAGGGGRPWGSGPRLPLEHGTCWSHPPARWTRAQEPSRVDSPGRVPHGACGPVHSFTWGWPWGAGTVITHPASSPGAAKVTPAPRPLRWLAFLLPNTQWEGRRAGPLGDGRSAPGRLAPEKGGGRSVRWWPRESEVWRSWLLPLPTSLPVAHPAPRALEVAWG